MEQATQDRITLWKSEAFDPETKAAILKMEESDATLLEDCFYKRLTFGTGGLRGEMGVGSNRMNLYTVGMATQGLATYMKKVVGPAGKVAIAYDSRHQSPEFAQKAAEVLSANGIAVYLYDELRPTPLLSFTVRELGCDAGIVITASHNPKEYNGYKVYWNDGGQLVPPHDSGIIEEVNAISDPSQVNSLADESLILAVPDGVEEKYYQLMQGLLSDSVSRDDRAELRIIFTSLHGTGITMVPEALERAGFDSLHVLASQQPPDGAFPTVKSPNPEERSAMTLALEEAESRDADIILGTDPDADRVGMGMRDKQGKMVLINGNQAAALLVHFLLENSSPHEKSKGFIAKTVVTSELLRDIASHHQVPCYETLTGFKYIAELIGKLEGKEQFIGGGEESYGYLVGDFVRDKDAVISSLMLCEMAAWALSQGKSVIELLDEIYAQYGVYREDLVSLVMKGMQGAADIRALMDGYRSKPPQELAGVAIERIADYKVGKVKSLLSGLEEDIALPSSDVMQFHLSDGSIVTARPSGTEPKIKYYISVKQAVADPSDVDAAWAQAGERVEAIKTALGI